MYSVSIYEKIIFFYFFDTLDLSFHHLFIIYYIYYIYYILQSYKIFYLLLLSGSDLAGETAAALAASSIVFSSVDPEYSAKCLEHAKDLYKFADVYRGLYHEAIRGAERYYESTDYGDELAWAAIWLFKATGDTKYFDDAIHHYQHFHLKERPNAFFYNKKVAGIQVKFLIYILFLF